MLTCPDCGYENLDGADECQQCQQSLSALAGPRPQNEVERRITEDRVGRLIQRDPWVVDPETPVGEVLKELVKRRVGCAVIAREGRLAGIFTERDVLVRLNAEAAERAGRPVCEFMTTGVETLEMDDRIAFAIQKMDVGGYRHIPILDEGRIVGVISARDILNYITAAM